MFKTLHGTPLLFLQVRMRILNLQIKPLDIATTIEYRVANSSALLVILFIDITKVIAGQRTGGFLMQS